MVNNKLSKKDKLGQSGVYQFNCNDCSCFYIGQTGGNYYVRFKEHISSLRLHKSNSTVANHPQYNSNHQILDIVNQSFKFS